jgi:hypothetical protein
MDNCGKFFIYTGYISGKQTIFFLYVLSCISIRHQSCLLKPHTVSNGRLKKLPINEGQTIQWPNENRQQHNNDIQNTTRTTKVWDTRTPTKAGVSSGVQKRCSVPAPLVTRVIYKQYIVKYDIWVCTCTRISY